MGVPSMGPGLYVEQKTKQWSNGESLLTILLSFTKRVFWVRGCFYCLFVACLNATVGAIRQLLLWCSSTSCSANWSSFSMLLCSPILLPLNRTDSTFFCFSISSDIRISVFMLLGLGSESTFTPQWPKLDQFAWWLKKFRSTLSLGSKHKQSCSIAPKHLNHHWLLIFLKIT